MMIRFQQIFRRFRERVSHTKVKSCEIRGDRDIGKYGKRAIVVLAGIWLWTFYIFQEELSRYGLYTIISYNIHEIASVIPFLCIGIAAACAISFMISVSSITSSSVGSGARPGPLIRFPFLSYMLAVIFFISFPTRSRFSSVISAAPSSNRSY